jgi:RHS repeat-associated protein
MAKANPFRFSTKFRDDESGLVYYGYRYYSPTTGRWLGRDTSGEQAALCLFLFCHNNPLIFLDSYGNVDWAVFWAGAGHTVCGLATLVGLGAANISSGGLAMVGSVSLGIGAGAMLVKGLLQLGESFGGAASPEAAKQIQQFPSSSGAIVGLLATGDADGSKFGCYGENMLRLTGQAMDVMSGGGLGNVVALEAAKEIVELAGMDANDEEP